MIHACMRRWLFHTCDVQSEDTQQKETIDLATIYIYIYILEYVKAMMQT